MGLLTLGTGEVVTISSAAYRMPIWLLTLTMKASTHERRFPCRSPRKSCERWSRWNARWCKRIRSSASTLRGTNLRRAARRRAILAGFCFVAGLGS